MKSKKLVAFVIVVAAVVAISAFASGTDGFKNVKPKVESRDMAGRLLAGETVMGDLTTGGLFVFSDIKMNDDGTVKEIKNKLLFKKQVEEQEVTTCKNCSQITSITLAYTGTSTDGTADATGKEKKGNPGEVLQSDIIINAAGEFTVTNIGHPETNVTVGNDTASFHSSCSRPIFIGDVVGEFTIVDISGDGVFDRALQVCINDDDDDDDDENGTPPPVIPVECKVSCPDGSGFRAAQTMIDSTGVTVVAPAECVSCDIDSTLPGCEIAPPSPGDICECVGSDLGWPLDTCGYWGEDPTGVVSCLRCDLADPVNPPASCSGTGIVTPIGPGIFVCLAGQYPIDSDGDGVNDTCLSCADVDASIPPPPECGGGGITPAF